VQQEVMCLKLRAHAVVCPSVCHNSSLSIKLLTNMLTSATAERAFSLYTSCVPSVPKMSKHFFCQLTAVSDRYLAVSRKPLKSKHGPLISWHRIDNPIQKEISSTCAVIMRPFPPHHQPVVFHNIRYSFLCARLIRFLFPAVGLISTPLYIQRTK
jgi:hypothetical protein